MSHKLKAERAMLLLAGISKANREPTDAEAGELLGLALNAMADALDDLHGMRVAMDKIAVTLEERLTREDSII